MAEQTRDQQRAELHKAIWSVADKLRGSVDGWDFKAYVLTTLFYRYISEEFAHYIDKGEHDAGDDSFSYATLTDEEAEMSDDEREELIKEKGLFIKPSQLFENVRAEAHKVKAADSNLNIILANAFKEIEESAIGFPSEGDIRGLFDDFDTSSRKLGNTVEQRNKKLLELMDGIGKMGVRGEPHRRVRRRLRVPDDHVRVFGWQVWRRVLYAAGGISSAHADCPGWARAREQGV